MKASVVATITVATLLSSVATAQVTRTGNGYLLRAKLTKGQVIRYKFSTVTSVTGASNTIVLPIQYRVLNVVKGISEVEFTQGPPTMNGNAIGGADVERAKIDSQLRAVSGKQSNISQTTFVAYPAGPVKVGGTWNGYQSLAAAGSSQVSMTYRLAEVKKEAGKTIAVVNLSLASKGKNKMSGKGVMKIDAADGMLRSISLSVTSSDLFTGSKTGPVSFTFVGNRL